MKSVTISRDEYERIKKKAALFDRLAESLTMEELAHIEQAKRGEKLTKNEFLSRHLSLHDL